jgi:hypothetical protein
MISHARIHLMIIAAGLSLPGLARAEDKIEPTGSWQIRVTRPGRPASESTLRLERSGDKLVGVMMDPQGRSTAVKDAKVKGDELSFRITVSRDGRQFDFNYKGKLTADTFKGKSSISVFGQTRSFDFDGTRMKGEALLPGFWKITVTMEDGGKIQPMFQLKHEGNDWSGDYVPVTGTKTPLQEVAVKAGELTFRAGDVIGGDKVQFDYKGKLAGDKLAGTAKVTAGKDISNVKFEAQKIEIPTANVAGTWKLKVAFRPDQTFDPVLKLEQTGNTLKGTYQGEQGETPITDALIFGDELTFDVVRRRSGSQYRLKYQGKVSGDTMKGFVEYDFDGITGFLNFEGSRVSQSQAKR